MRAHLLAALLLLAPVAATFATAGGNVFSDPTCVATAPCVDPVPCVPDVRCDTNACAPAAQCHAMTSLVSACNEKPIAEGRTCDTTLLVEAGSLGPDGRLNGVSTTVSVSDGGVQLENLPNTWFSDGARVALVLGGQESGAVAASLYRSEQQAPGGFRARQVGAGATYDGGFEGGEPVGVVVGVLFLDDVPESCYARLDPVAGASCPRWPVLP